MELCILTLSPQFSGLCLRDNIKPGCVLIILLTLTLRYPRDTGLFVTGSMDKTVVLWDTNEWECASRFPVETKVNDVGLSRLQSVSHSIIAVASDSKHVQLCDMISASFTHSLIGHS